MVAILVEVLVKRNHGIESTVRAARDHSGRIGDGTPDDFRIAR
jgi:hypothetical protein